VHLVGFYFMFFLYFVLWETFVLKIEEMYCSDMWYTPTSLNGVKSQKQFVYISGK